MAVHLNASSRRRRAKHRRLRRWLTNLGIVVLGSIVVRIMALLARSVRCCCSCRWWRSALHTCQLNGARVCSTSCRFLGWLEIIIALLVLDFAIWLQHLASHKFPVLWRLHRVHHADPDFDVTTAIRFHPDRNRAFDALQSALGAAPRAFGDCLLCYSRLS